MSITIRPEREQAEHDRLIHFLQGKYDKDNYEVVANPGDEQNAAVKIATRPHFPDLVLNSDKKLAGVVEIETAASVNRLETMYKWVPFSRARVPFHLYVPVQGYDTALRLVETHQVKAAEIWTYRPAIEGFDLVRMYVDASAEKAAASSGASRPARPAKAAKAAKAAKRAPAASPRASSTGTGKARSTARPATRAKAAKAAKPAKAAKATASAGRRKAAAPARKPAKRASASSTRRTPARATAKATKAAKKSTGARGRR